MEERNSEIPTAAVGTAVLPVPVCSRMVPETPRKSSRKVSWKPSLESFPRSGLHLQNLRLPAAAVLALEGADRKAAKEDIERRSSCPFCKGVVPLCRFRSGTGLRSRCGCGRLRREALFPGRALKEQDPLITLLLPLCGLPDVILIAVPGSLSLPFSIGRIRR